MPYLFLDRRVRLIDHAGNVSSHCEENQGRYVQEHAGHFPATENPTRFVPHLLEAIEFIQKRRAE